MRAYYYEGATTKSTWVRPVPENSVRSIFLTRLLRCRRGPLRNLQYVWRHCWNLVSIWLTDDFNTFWLTQNPASRRIYHSVSR